MNPKELTNPSRLCNEVEIFSQQYWEENQTDPK